MFCNVKLLAMLGPEIINATGGSKNVDKTNSSRDEVRLRSNDVCSQPIDKEVEVDIHRLLETLDCE